MRRSELIAHVKNEYCDFLSDADPKVAAAVANCAREFQDKDSLVLPVSRSIHAKVAKHFDPAVREFFLRTGACFETATCFSDLLLIDEGAADLKIVLALRTLRSRRQAHLGDQDELAAIDGLVECSDVLRTGFIANRKSKESRIVATFDLLRDFNRLCRAYRATRVRTATIERVDGIQAIEENERRLTVSKVERFPADLTFMLQQGKCELCARDSEVEVMTRELLNTATSEEAKLLRQQRLRVASLSDRYCADHSPNGGRKYQRDIKRRPYLLFTMRLVIEVRLLLRKPALVPEDLREFAYSLVCGKGGIPLPVKRLYKQYRSMPQPRLKSFDPQVLIHCLRETIRVAERNAKT